MAKPSIRPFSVPSLGSSLPRLWTGACTTHTSRLLRKCRRSQRLSVGPPAISLHSVHPRLKGGAGKGLAPRDARVSPGPCHGACQTQSTKASSMNMDCIDQPSRRPGGARHTDNPDGDGCRGHMQGSMDEYFQYKCLQLPGRHHCFLSDDCIRRLSTEHDSAQETQQALCVQGGAVSPRSTASL
jgi:hypothetical protein